MGHVHDEAESNYFTEQLCTIGICGALGGVAVMLYARNILINMLVPWLHWTVLAGGIALLLMAALRAVIVWVAAGKAKAHNHDHGHAHTHDHDHELGHTHTHDHDHEHCCGHDHDHGHEHGHTHEEGVLAEAHDHHHEPEAVAGHTHDHGHEHGWGPWRYAVLLLPVMLYFLDMPGAGFANIHAKEAVDPNSVKLDSTGPGRDMGEVSFRELTGIAYSPDRRAGYQGNIVHLKGQFLPSSYGERVFRLVRMKMSCCAADAVPVDATIMVDPKSKETPNGADLRMKWVEVKGQISFQKRQAGNFEEWRTVILVRPTEQEPLGELIKLIDLTADPQEAFIY